MRIAFEKFIIVLLVFYVIWLSVRISVADYFTIPSESMCPTLKPGDKVVVNKLIMGGRIYKQFNFDGNGQDLQSWRLKGLRSVRHNDICVFNYPKHEKRISFVINDCFCKRCVALPGDSLRIENGFYYNNNYDGIIGHEEEQRRLELLPDSIFSKQTLIDKFLGWTLKNFGPLYVPRRGDILAVSVKDAIVYRHILEWELGKKLSWSLSENEVYVDGNLLTTHLFKHNYYFMAGDNVCMSYDSRYWGLVPEEYIIGVVGWIIPE